MAQRKSEFLSAFGKAFEIFKAIVDAVMDQGGNDEDIRKILSSKKLRADIAKLIVSVKNELLSLLSEGKELVIPSQDGTSLLSKASDVFSWIDPDFTNWKLNEHGPSTDATSVEVFKMRKDATFKDLFTSLSPNPDSLCLTQSQIKEFCRTNRSWLRTDGFATFFLFKRESEFFVARVSVDSVSTLWVDVSRFEDSHIWRAESRHRVVSPQLAV